MKIRVVVTDGHGKKFEGEATLVAVNGARAPRSAPRPKPPVAGRVAPDFSLPVRAFVKRYAKGLGGPQKFALLLARLSGGKTAAATGLKEIEKAWNRMTGLMGGKFHPMYAVRAKENGWVDTPKTAHYTLRSTWAEALDKQMAAPDGADLEELLLPAFAAKHVRAAVKHLQAMATEFQQGAWEEAIGKGGKFVEAALKAVYVHAGKTLPAAREFKAGTLMTEIEQLPAGSFDDAVKLTIPRACRFIYDIASNRGARHDPGEVNPNEMDARAVVAGTSQIAAEMLRYAQKGSLEPALVRELVDGLTQRRYPLVEDVEGRVYFHVPRASARDVALLSLWHRHPGRMSADELVAAVMRHHFKKGNAAVAVSRLGRFVDRDARGGLRLLQPGMRLAEELIASRGQATTQRAG